MDEMSFEDFITKNPRLSEFLEIMEKNFKEGQRMLYEWKKHLKELSTQIQSDKISKIDKLYLANHIEYADDRPGNFVPLKIIFKDISVALKMYEIDPSDGRKDEIPELGLRCVYQRGNVLNCWFYGESKYGNPIKRLNKILNDKNIIRVEIRK